MKKWESQHLAEGPYGLRDIRVYSGVCERALPATYDFRSMAAGGIAFCVFGIGGPAGPHIIAMASMVRLDDTYITDDISAAALWLEDMVRVWGQEESL